MRRLLPAVIILTAIYATGTFGSADAQVPYVQIYFDSNLHQTTTRCTENAAYDTLHVVAHNMNADISSIEYRIHYTEWTVFLGDLLPPGAASVGDSNQGIRISYSSPLSVFAPAVVQSVRIGWACNEECPLYDYGLIVQPHPESGKVVAHRWLGGTDIEAVGMASLLCGSVDTEERTWGRIKALYR